MFRHRQPLRLWAARVLFVWVFALVAGMAHACLTSGQPMLPVHAHAADDAVSEHCSDEASAHAGLSKANCQVLCEKTSVSVPTLKSALDDLPSLALITTAAIDAVPEPACAPAQSWVPRRDGAQAPPIPIAFLRLAL